MTDSLTTAAGGEHRQRHARRSIIVVMNGLKIAFSGSIQPWELVRVVIGLWIPWVMLQFYMTTIPGMAFTFPAVTGFTRCRLLNAKRAWRSRQIALGNITTQGQQGSILGVLSGGAHALKMALIGVVDGVHLPHAPYLVCHHLPQVIWAHIALAILTILGPIFIPFLVFEPLSFLFWGWFRAMIT